MPVAFHRLVAASLKQSALEQKLLPVHVDQIHGACGGSRRAAELDSHGANRKRAMREEQGFVGWEGIELIERPIIKLAGGKRFAVSIAPLWATIPP
jgi:hypothetical protein